MDAMGLLLLVVALLIGAALGALVSRAMLASKDAATAAARSTELAELRAIAADARSDAARAQSEAAMTRADLARANAEQAGSERAVAEARAVAEQARADAAEVGARLAAAEAQRDAAVKLAEELGASRDALVQQFKLLSAETLKEQGQRADAVAEQRLAATRALMDPVEKSLSQLNERITQVEKERSQLAAGLREQVSTVVAASENLRRETYALSTALRRPQVRGAWGELQLRRVVEVSGMLDHCDFYEQASDVTSADARIRPDLKVMLGGDKFVYVDSKVPLAAYLDAMEADSDTDRQAKLQQFGEHVKGHVDKLSAKEYWKVDSHSPEFVVLFIPNEALAAEALTQRPDLHEYAAGRNIILATPTTLIGMLRAVAYGWKQAALADSAAEVFTLGRELHDRLSTMGGHFSRLGRSLQSSVNAYNATLGSLEGRVLVSARRLRDLRVTDKELEGLKGVDESAKLMSAPELLADAAAEPDPGRGRDRVIRGELDQIAPRQPEIAELVDEEQAPRPAALRQLG